jgi:hypothetical protein
LCRRASGIARRQRIWLNEYSRDSSGEAAHRGWLALDESPDHDVKSVPRARARKRRAFAPAQIEVDRRRAERADAGNFSGACLTLQNGKRDI